MEDGPNGRFTPPPPTPHRDTAGGASTARTPRSYPGVRTAYGDTGQTRGRPRGRPRSATWDHDDARQGAARGASSAAKRKRTQRTRAPAFVDDYTDLYARLLDGGGGGGGDDDADDDDADSTRNNNNNNYAGGPGLSRGPQAGGGPHQGGGDAYDGEDAFGRENRLLAFRGVEFSAFNHMAGNDIREVPGDKQRNAARVERVLQARKRQLKIGAFGGSAAATEPEDAVLAIDDPGEAYAELITEDAEDDARAAAIRAAGDAIDCPLCDHAEGLDIGGQPSAMALSGASALKAIQYMDRALIMTMPDNKLYIRMAHVFNRRMFQILRRGHPGFFLTPAQIRDHFMVHDITNPLRPMANSYRLITDIIAEGSKYVIGIVNGKKSWNEGKTRLLMSLIDRQARIMHNLTEARAHVLDAMRGDDDHGGGGGGGGGASRHANGASASRAKYNRK